jgi:4-hydroxy-tetrahydrodipicolinate synthase
MLWCTSGVGEFWSLTLHERKLLLEVAIGEARSINPDIVVQACTAAMTAKDCLELTPPSTPARISSISRRR